MMPKVSIFQTIENISKDSIGKEQFNDEKKKNDFCGKIQLSRKENSTIRRWQCEQNARRKAMFISLQFIHIQTKSGF